MAYNSKYIVSWDNEISERMDVHFLFNGFSGSPQVFDGAGDPLVIRSTSADDDINAPILGSEAIIKIQCPNNNITIDDFVVTTDDECKVVIYRDGAIEWQGWLVVEDNSQPFLDAPYTITLRATDGLGLLKDIDFKDPDGNGFSGIYNIVKIILNVLFRINEDFRVKVYTNLFNVNFEDRTFNGTKDTFNQTFLQIYTFEDKKCYAVLESIMIDFKCRIFQQEGAWHIVSLFEYMNGFSFTEYEFPPSVSPPPEGYVITGFGNGISYDTNIGKNENIFPVNDDALMYLKVATKSIKQTYRYDDTSNVACNQDLQQGDRLPAYDGVNAEGENYLAYTTFCWTHKAPPYGGTTPPTKVSYIASVTDSFGHVKDRYVVVQKESPSTWLESTLFFIDANDKIDFSVKTRAKNNYNGSGTENVAIVVLIGASGQYYVLAGDTGQWFATTSGLALTKTIHVNFSTGQDRNWFNASVSSQAAPESGQIAVLLTEWTQSGGGGNESWFNDIKITRNSFINGSYTKSTGDVNLSSQTAKIRQTIDDEVEISDSPKRYIKGALIDFFGAILQPKWIYKNTTGYSTAQFRFRQLVEYCMYSLLFKQYHKIEGSFKMYTWNDNGTNRPAGFYNRYFFVDGFIDPTSPFVLTSFERDYGRGISRCVFKEVPKQITEPDTYSFTYLFE